MPKRSSEMEADRKMRKIRKMQRKIEKYKEALTASDPEAMSILEEDSVHEDVNSLGDKVSPQSDRQEKNDGIVDLAQEGVQEEEQLEEGDVIELEEDVPQDILAALGQGGLDADADYGPELKAEIINIFNNILTDGLNKEMQETLSKTKIPRNAKLLDAPKLNSEFSGLLNTSVTNRDNLLKARQQDMGRAIALITQTINDLTKKDFNKLQAIKSLSDSLRILSNLHHQYTQIRRRLIAPFMEKTLIQNLNENKRSEYLYSKLEESVKTSSAIKRTMNILKPKNTNTKNYQAPRRQTAAPNQYRTNNNHQKPRPYQQTTSYKTQRSQARPPPPPRQARRPVSSHYKGGRAKYP